MQSNFPQADTVGTRKSVRLWEVKNVVFVCSCEHDQVSAYEMRPPMGGVR